ncbi:MAG: M24 family metallopeptidase [Bacillota bacterium]
MSRIKKLLELLKGKDIDGMLLIKDSNIRYLSGYTGTDSYIIISEKGNSFITDARYTEQAEAECPDFEVVRWKAPALGLTETFNVICSRHGIKKLAFEKDKVTFDLYEKLKSDLENVELIPTIGIVEGIRYVKVQAEVEHIKKAAAIADEAFNEILGYIKPGVSEKYIANELQYIIKKKGADDIAFSCIIASGKNSSLPHAIPSDKLIEQGDFVTLDFGAKYKGYRSDMTRTVVVGKADDKQKEIYNIVKAAQELGVKAVKAGISGKAPDDQARNLITAAGYGPYFGHGLGHGLGLEIHEEPFLNPSCTSILQPGNTLTIEPGIYIPGWGGVRIEDTVAVTDNGAEILTKSSKELIELEI